MIRPWSQRVPFNDQGLRRVAATVSDGVNRVRVEVRQRGAVGARVRAEALGVETRRDKPREERHPKDGLFVSEYQDWLDDQDLTEDQKEYYMALFRERKQLAAGEELLNLRNHRGY